MTISSAINIGINGVQRSSQAIAQSAQEIASVGTTQRDTATTQDLVEPLLNIQREQQLFDASARVIQVGNNTIGSILDIKA